MYKQKESGETLIEWAAHLAEQYLAPTGKR